MIGRYEVVRELRGGGMGTVTLGRSPDGHLVVLKRPHSIDLDAGVRLRDEARIGARLLHPSLVDTLDLFELDSGLPVLVVAYVDGPSLEVLRPLGPLPPVVIARIGRQIAEGLAALHETTDEHGSPLHILHRDVTPGNIVVGKDGDAKLIDLGIARFSERQAEHTQDGFLRGTMRYLAPELLQGETYTAASDLWSLGMVLWEAAIGRFAYRGETDREVLAGILRGAPMELDDEERVDEELVAAIRPLLELSPLSRVKSGEEVAAHFAALEERWSDADTDSDLHSAQLTRRAVADALERKIARDAAHKAKLDEMLRPENLGFPTPGHKPVIGDADLFADVATAAEVDRYDENEQYDLPHGTSPEVRARAAREGRTLPPPIRDDVDEDPTVPLKTTRADAKVAALAGDFEDKTVNVPAPLSFLSPPPAAPGSGEGDGEDDLDRTTPMAVLPRAEPQQDEQQQYPPLTFEGEDTASFSDPRVPKEALRSDAPDLPERADEFDTGEEPSAPAARIPAALVPAPLIPAPLTPAPLAPLVATAAPAPELDDDDLEDMHTMDGLSPVRPSAEGAFTGAAAEAATRALGRVAIVRKSAAQIEEERRAAARSIDDLPPARPKPRVEADDTLIDLSPVAPAPPRPAPRQELMDDVTAAATLSPFSSSSEAEAEHDEGRGKPAKSSARKRRKSKKARQTAEPDKAAALPEASDKEQAAVAEDREPSSLETRFLDEAVLRAQLAEQTQVSPPSTHGELPSSAFGARLIELPQEQPPILLSRSFPTHVPEGQEVRALLAEPNDDVVENAPAKEELRERAAGEVMKLSDMIAFLDDD